nr:tyrosine-type recombinase/integrase [Roseitranquillus sediminis]
MRLHDAAGNRLYLNAEERAAFLAAARRHGGRDRTLCETLHYTGCRRSELLEITPARVDLSGGTIAIRSLKKRRDATGTARIVYRSVPVPPDCLDTLDTAHDLRKVQSFAQAGERAALADRPRAGLADREADHDRGRDP